MKKESAYIYIYIGIPLLLWCKIEINTTLHCKELSVQFSHSVMSDSLQPHGLQQARLPWSLLTPRACSNSCPLSRWCHPTISSCHPLLLLPSIFPSTRVFSNESVLHKVLELQLQHQSFQWIFKVDFLWKWKWKLYSHAQLCDPMDYTVHGILQARILEWVAYPFSRESS